MSLLHSCFFCWIVFQRVIVVLSCCDITLFVSIPTPFHCCIALTQRMNAWCVVALMCTCSLTSLQATQPVKCPAPLLIWKTSTSIIPLLVALTPLEPCGLTLKLLIYGAANLTTSTSLTLWSNKLVLKVLRLECTYFVVAPRRCFQFLTKCFLYFVSWQHSYSSESQWTPITGNWRGASSLPLWWATYDGQPGFNGFQPFGGWDSPAIHQYQGTSTLCSASVDLNYY